MQTIRIIANNENAEILVSDSKHLLRVVEPFHTIKASLLFDFLVSWKDWIRQVDALQSGGGVFENEDYSAKLNEFSNYLRTLLFGNSLGTVKLSTARIICDLEFSAFPFELIQTDHNKIFRIIRSERQPPNGRRGIGFLYLENHFKAESILKGMKEERAEVQSIWNSYRVESKQLVGHGFTKNRFLEKISSTRYAHYSGHSYEDGLHFDNHTKIDEETIASFDLSNLQMIYFNSCSSATLLATTFLQAGVKEVVGFLGDVRNEVAMEAGKVFWTEFLRNRSAFNAVSKVRKSLEMKFGKAYPGSYQLVYFGESRKPVLFNFTLTSKTVYACLSLLIAIFLFYVYVRGNSQPITLKTDGISKQELEMEKKTTAKKNRDLLVHGQQKTKEPIVEAEAPLTKKTDETSDKVMMRKETKTSGTNSKMENLEKFLDEHHSKELKKEVIDFLNKEDSTLISREKKEEEIFRLLSSEENTELIRYKLRQMSR